MTQTVRIAVYFTSPEPNGPPFNEAEYVESYHEFAERIVRKGHRFSIVRGRDTFLGKGRFTKHWEFQDGSFILRAEEIQPDVVYNKGEDLRFDDGTHVVNEPAFDDLCTKKERTYELFSAFMPKTILVEHRVNLEHAMDEIPSSIIVAKPHDGACGRGVVIGPREQILSVEHRYPLLVQEFIDSSVGIPGLMEGTHDTRVVFVGGKVAYAHYKIPKPGSLISNVALGGKYFVIPDAKIPTEELALAHSVDAQLANFPSRVYSVDMCRSASGRWMLIELNSPPALIATSETPESQRYHELLAEHLIAIGASPEPSHKRTFLEIRRTKDTPPALPDAQHARGEGTVS